MEHIYHVAYFTIDEDKRWVDQDGELTDKLRKAGRYTLEEALGVARAYLERDCGMQGVEVVTAEPESRWGRGRK